LGTLGRFDEALSHVQQAYVLDPLAIDSRNNALWIYYFSGRTSDTIEQARKAVEIEPRAGLPYAMLAMANAQLGRRPETLEAANNAIRFADSPSVLTTTASAVAHLGDGAAAKRILKKALDEAKERYVCRFLVASAYAELGEREKALDSLEAGYLQRST
jgi:tetratricopeptide (TPR) repeat protein